MRPELDLAARLRDLHPPEAPSWWPPAPGWWLLLALAVALAVLALRYGPGLWRRLRLRWHLGVALRAIERRHRAGAPATETAAEVSQLLRIAVLARFPERGAAGLYGAAWVAFLEACDRAPGRFATLGETLTVAPYLRPGRALDAAPLLAAARGWLRAVL